MSVLADKRLATELPVAVSTVVQESADAWKVHSTSESLYATKLHSSETTAYLVKSHCPSGPFLRTVKMNRPRKC